MTSDTSHTKSLEPEQPVTIVAGDLALEGRLRRGTGPGAAVITHPHPLYGGDMDNAVVALMAEVFARHRLTTLRFNFRGTGASQGRFDNGRGEADDVRAALGHVHRLGLDPVLLAGYSFGAWVNAHAAPTTAMVMVAPPLAFLPFDDCGAIAGLQLVIAGSRDDFCPIGMLEKTIPLWNPAAKLVVIDGADHFFSGRAGRLAGALELFAKPPIDTRPAFG